MPRCVIAMDQEQQNKATFLALFDGLKARDIEAMAVQMTEQPNWIVWGNTLSGDEGLTSILEAAPSYYQEETIVHDLQGLWCDGDTVIARMMMTARTFSDEDYANEYIWIAQFDGGKVAEVREYLDLRVIEKHFGKWE